MISSIHTAFKVIKCFSHKTQELGISEFAAILGKNRSTVHHIVLTMYNEGVLVRTPNRKYRLGTKLLSWGEMVHEQYKSFFMATPIIDNLVKRTNEIVHLAIIENEEVSYLIKKEPNKPINIATGIGTRQPLYCTGLGKALLAFQSKSFIDKVITKGMTKRTDNTIHTREKLIQELTQIRKQGYAIDNEEFEEGLFCIAAPIRDYMGNVVCAISVTGPEFRMNTERLSIRTSIVMSNAMNISRQCDL
ncbi:IclR family transcriptional regulator [Brevibacillus daliensis]|uniref:IclR family transcriptional regulator n=1 Tax=Brevibacillus daliensis TaxID=2892995 RepID=UPI001E47D176|nr:IclR family transcriptional regulator [Brevibacillus daliensis]